jgi:hypothetical protein
VVALKKEAHFFAVLAASQGPGAATARHGSLSDCGECPGALRGHLQPRAIFGNVDGPVRKLPQGGHTDLELIARPGFLLNDENFAELALYDSQPLLDPPDRFLFPQAVRN